MEKLLVSACLIGKNTKYNGKNNYVSDIEKLKDKYEFIIICPEIMGGLSTPRFPSEIKGDKIINSNGDNVTKEFIQGKNLTCDIAKKNNITKALLKDGSPSCGSNYIYDGTFSKTKIAGNGITAKGLREMGIIIYTEKDINNLL